MNKQINVKNNKWKKFGKWCVIHDTTITKKIDEFLDEVLGGK